jgi:hypothetical protein
MGDYTAITAFAVTVLIVIAIGLVWKFLVRTFVHRENIRDYRHSSAHTP